MYMCCLQMHTIDTSRQQRRKLPAPPIQGAPKVIYNWERERERDSLCKIQYTVQVSKEGKSLSYEMNRESLIDCPIVLIFHVLALYTPLLHLKASPRSLQWKLWQWQVNKSRGRRLEKANKECWMLALQEGCCCCSMAGHHTTWLSPSTTHHFLKVYICWF